MCDSALVLFSGGQDSTTCLAWALEHYDAVETVGFDYRQRHKIELSRREIIRNKLCKIKSDWLSKLGKDHLIDLSLISQLGDTALTTESEIKILSNGLPSTFVPGRNLFFFITAASIAYRRNISTLVGGMCETDYSGYPDCRNNTLTTLQSALNQGLDKKINIKTPLMWLTKEKIWQLSNELGGSDFIEIIINDTHSCYRGERRRKWEWGYGCNDCPACELRMQGFVKFKKVYKR